MTKILYTAHGYALHGGRTGNGATDDGKVSVLLSVPKEMGGDGGPGTNPEQLFSIGYSACFLGSMNSVARKRGTKLPEGAMVSANVSFADREDNVGFTIVAELVISLPGMPRAEVEELARLTHDVCAYSHLIRSKSDVKLTVAE